MMELWQAAFIAALWFGAGVVYGWWKWSGGNHCRHRRIEEVSEGEFYVRCKACGQLLFGYVDDDAFARPEHPS